MHFVKNIFTSVFIAVALVACGGGSSSSIKKPENIVGIQDGYINYRLIKKIDFTPSFEKKIPYYVVNEDPLHTRLDTEPSYNTDWSRWSRHMGVDIDKVNEIEKANNKDYTGISDPEILVNGNGRGSFSRIHGNQYESFIDTTSFPNYNIRGAGPHNTLSAETNIPAIGAGIIGTFKMPYIQTNKGVNQLSMFFYLKNQKYKDQAPIGFVNIISDNRPEYSDFKPYVGHDTYTFFASQKIDSNLYTTRLTPQKYTSTVFSEDRDYGFVITKENLENILRDLKLKIDESKKNGKEVGELDMNPENYYVSLMGYFQEVFTFNDPDIYMKSGYSVKNMKIFQTNFQQQ